MGGCELCRLERLTARHYEDALIVICDCRTCGVPMLVFQSHGRRKEDEHHRARAKILQLYGKRLIRIRTKARKVVDHEHWHIYLEKE